MTFPVPGELGYWNPRPPGIPAGNPGECMFRGISGILGEIRGSSGKCRGSSGKPAFFLEIPRNFAYENTEISEIFFVTNPRIPDLRRANSPPRNFPGNVGEGTGTGNFGDPVAPMHSSVIKVRFQAAFNLLYSFFFSFQVLPSHLCLFSAIKNK